MRPIAFAWFSVNQRFPSGPVVMSLGSALRLVVGRGNSVMSPDGVIRPIRSVLDSVNHRLPSGPVVTEAGSADGDGMGNCVMVLVTETVVARALAGDTARMVSPMAAPIVRRGKALMVLLRVGATDRICLSSSAVP